ncbi:MAG: AmpG family muropeptide MFS transporter [Synechococcales cyanobacterium]
MTMQKALQQTLQQTFQRGLGVYGQGHMLVLLLMGFSSGLPLVLLGQPLQAWLTESGVGVITIGLFALTGIPYSLKFLWSPFLDRYTPSLPGRLRGSRRRGWLLIFQILLLFVLLVLGRWDPAQGVEWFYGVVLLVAFLSASQDIVVDAYRTDLLTEAEMGAGVAVYVLGYRIAVLVGGSTALWLATWLSWAQVYNLLAALLLPLLLITYFAPEPEPQGSPKSLVEAVVKPFQAFWQRYPRTGLRLPLLERPLALLTLLFVVVYQLADRLSSPVTANFLLTIGFTKTDLSLRIWLIFWATVTGVSFGGWVVKRLGIPKSLLLFGLLMGVSNLSYMVVALLGVNYGAMFTATVIDNFCAGAATAAFLGFLMSLCDKQFSATQYALLSSLFPLGGTVLGSLSGYLATLGWPLFFALTALATLPGMGLMLMILAGQRATQAAQDMPH